jgi:hypothetical protein
MHVLLLTLALVSPALRGPAVDHRPSFEPLAIAASASTLVLHQQTTPQPPPPTINVEVNRSGGGRAWYVSPVWMAIGGIALVLVILMIVLAARGGGSGGTTVVRG